MGLTRRPYLAFGFELWSRLLSGYPRDCETVSYTMGRRGIKLQLKSYAVKKRRRRLTKRRERREGQKATDPQQDTTQQSLTEEQEGSAQEDTPPLNKVQDEAVADRSEDRKLRAIQQASEQMKSDYERLRKLLYMEQRRPRIFEKDCTQCLRRSAKLAAAMNTLHTMMFSGKSFGSRYLLAALKRDRNTRNS